MGASVLSIQILNPGSGVTRELWSGLAGGNVGDLPLSTASASIDATLTTLEDAASYPANTGERPRGYLVAPATGNYRFWLAASNAAELWISDDNEPVNLLRRVWVSAPGTGAESWNDAGQTHQRTPWLSLVVGQTYYYEVLHNTDDSGSSNGANKLRTSQATATTNDTDSASNVSVAYLLDMTGLALSPGTNPVVPGYLLNKFDYPNATAATRPPSVRPPLT